MVSVLILNVANRAYYAAFQAAVAALMKASIPVWRDKGGLISHHSIHSQFAGTLIARRKLYPARLRSVLQNLIRERIVADYRALALSQRRAAHALRQAQGFVATVTTRLEGRK